MRFRPKFYRKVSLQIHIYICDRQGSIKPGNLTLTLQVSRDSQTNKPIAAQTRDKWTTLKEENYKDLRSHFFAGQLFYFCIFF